MNGAVEIPTAALVALLTMSLIANALCYYVWRQFKRGLRSIAQDGSRATFVWLVRATVKLFNEIAVFGKSSDLAGVVLEVTRRDGRLVLVERERGASEMH